MHRILMGAHPGILWFAAAVTAGLIGLALACWVEYR